MSAGRLSSPALQGGLLALLAAALFGLSTPLVQRFGAGLGPFSTAALLYIGAAVVALLLRRPASREAAETAPWVLSAGELQDGAFGLAASLPARGVDGSVGVIGLAPIDAESIGPQVVAAAGRIAAALTSGRVR